MAQADHEYRTQMALAQYQSVTERIPNAFRGNAFRGRFT
jgi:hypothetical protein